MESHRGSDFTAIQTLHDYLLRVEAQLVVVGGPGTAAVRTLRDELLTARQACVGRAVFGDQYRSQGAISKQGLGKVNFTKIMCIFTVFAIMSSKQLAKAGPAIKKSVAKCRARGSSCDASPAKGSLDKKPDKTPVNVMRRATQIWGAEEDDVAKKDD
ncbi:unnamed protein product [Prorocentrum cordatum]|uniref:Uncharacterized protein n=1 Tax=Prorocentrum cordatum TaxID=2364126 RepID=A0ABN9Y9S4_9DINO|nr:unnamed protein product [Polarella glacialis]